VTIVASVVDPDGEDDIVGGTLEGSNRGLAFGAFTLLRGGTYQLTLSWEDAYAVEAFSFVGSKDLPVTALFRDRSGAEATAHLSLTLGCDGFEQGAVCDDGVCTDLADDDDNCGACGTECEIQNPGSSFQAGGCSPDGCLPVWDDTCITESDGFTDCAEFCASQGQTCTPGCSGESARAYFGSVNQCETIAGFSLQADCDLDFNFVASGVYRCCCV
jgi:hypothetical protein